MAEYLIQSETLDDIADAINAKTGGSSAMTPAEMVEAIGSIETGGGDVADSLQKITSVVIKNNGEPAKFKCNLPYCSSFSYTNYGSNGIEEIDCQMYDGEKVSISLGATLDKGDKLRIANFHGARVAPHERQSFWNRPNLTELWVRLDYTRDTNTRFDRVFANSDQLEEIRAIPNTAFYGFPDFSGCAHLSNESAVSIANALGATTGMTLKLSGTTKTKSSTIVGTVSQVTEDSSTYDFFTADENGTVTLLNFITNTKGWTVA